MERADPIPSLKRAAAAVLARRISDWASAYDVAVLVGTQRARVARATRTRRLSPLEILYTRRPCFTEAAERRTPRSGQCKRLGASIQQ
jgi:hypothetical protein